MELLLVPIRSLRPGTHTGARRATGSKVARTLVAVGAGEVGFSTGILAVCSFKHLWEQKMAFSYYFFAAEAYTCQGSSAGLRDVSEHFWVVSPKDGTAAGKSIPDAACPPAPQP